MGTKTCVIPTALVWRWQGPSEASVVAGTGMLLVFSSVAVIKRLVRHHDLEALWWPGKLSWLWGPGALLPGAVSSAASVSSATVGLGSNSEEICQETQGLEGNAAGDSIGRALPSVDVGAEPCRHIPP